MENIVERPTVDEQRLALKYLDSVSKLAESFASRKQSVVIEVSDHENVHLEISPKIFRLLKEILLIMAQGKALSLIPSESEITTQQAAEMLNVSRPYLVKLLETGTIPFHKVGKHRRILLEDIVNYMRQVKKVREEALQELVDQAQALELGY
jgi:excisionase family DNA binding protein